MSLLGALSISVFNSVVVSTAVLATVWAGGYDVGVFVGMSVIPLALMGNAFGIAGGFGTGELAFEYFLSTRLGLLRGTGATIALVYHSAKAALRGIAYAAAVTLRRLEGRTLTWAIRRGVSGAGEELPAGEDHPR